MSRPILEVIVLTPRDAVAAERGGADRLEVVTEMAAGGLTPAPDTVAAIRDAVDLPLRVMVRCNAGFTATGRELDGMLHDVARLRAAGATEFVFGLLTTAGEVDIAACRRFAAAVAGCPWTFHRALDNAADRSRAWRAVSGLTGVDTVLTAGSAAGVGSGLPTLLAEAEAAAHDDDGVTRRLGMLVGGGLGEDHVPALRAAGVTALHIGTAARSGGWAGPVDPAAVRRWAALGRTEVPFPDRTR
jgi:copper homeostasis protein